MGSIMLLPVHKIQPPQWMRDPDLIRVLDTLNHNDVNARMVGGCIRNNYLNKPVYDIDIACKLNPEMSIDLLQKAGIKTIPTGIKHGTITAHVNRKNFEITTLRRDIDTDGRHAQIVFSDSWIEDAKRRDFTINSLYADRDGSVYDPTGEGFTDLQNGIIRFIGDPEKRIQEDYLRILRFFRFSTRYSQCGFHAKSLDACAKYKNGLAQLSDERITDELFKILSDDSAPTAIQKLFELQIFDLKHDKSQELESLIDLQKQLQKNDINSRYYTSELTKNTIKNKKINLFINKIDRLKNNWENNIKKSLYFYDRNVVIQTLLIIKSEGVGISDTNITNAINLPTPIFPIIATDIMTHFKIGEGPAVGKHMKRAEEIWVASDFKLSRDAILEKI